MSSFDIDEYLRLRADASNKLQKVADATQRKHAELEKISSVPAATAWSDSLGLTPGGFASNRVNDAASIVSGVSRMAGEITSLPFTAYGAVQLNSLDDEDIQAYNRAKAGTASPEDYSRLDRTPMPGGDSIIQNINKYLDSQKTARSINDFTDLSGTVNQANRNKLVESLKAKGSDHLQGMQDAWGKGEYARAAGNAVGLIPDAVSAAVDNPAGVREYAIENAPQLVTGAFGWAGRGAMLASNLGYAGDNFQKGLEAVAKKTGGQLPSKEEIGDKALLAGSLAAAESVGDLVGLGASKIGTLVKGAEKTAEEVQKATRRSFKDSLLAVPKAAGGAAIGEAPTEGYQTWAENEIVDKATTAEDIFVGSAIGAASGGTLAGGLRGTVEVLGATPEHAEIRKTTADKETAFKEAITSGDIKAYTDPDSAEFAPSKVISALFEENLTGDLAPEVREANLAKAHEVVADLEGWVEVAERHTPERVAKLQTAIDQDTAALAALVAKDPEDPEVAAIERRIAIRSSAIEGAPQTKEEIKQHAVALAKGQKELEDARTRIAAFTQQEKSAEVDLDAAIERVNAPVDVADTAAIAARSAAVEHVINLSMAAPGRVTAEMATTLAQNTANGLTPKQRNYLRAFSEARVAENALRDFDEVSRRVYFGGEGDVGIRQYYQRVSQALSVGNQRVAARNLDTLGMFEADHRQKAAQVMKARALLESTGNPVEVLSNGNGGWFISKEAPLSQKDRTTNGGLLIHKNTPVGLLEGIQAEATAITAAHKELEAAYALKFPTKSKESPSVPITPQAPQSSQAAPTTNTNPQVEAAGSNAKAAEPAFAPAVEGNAPGKPRRVGNDPGNATPKSKVEQAIEDGEVGYVEGVPVSVEKVAGVSGQVAQNLKKVLLGTLTTEQRAKVYVWATNWIDQAYTWTPTVQTDKNADTIEALVEALQELRNASAPLSVEASGDTASHTGAVDGGAARIGGDAGNNGAVSRTGTTKDREQVASANPPGPLPWETDEEFAARQPKAEESNEKTSVEKPTGVPEAPHPATAVELSGETKESKDSTTGQDASPVEDSQTSEEESGGSTEPQAGQLAVMSKTSAEGTPYNQRNLIADGFTQEAGSSKAASRKPLVLVQNFMQQSMETILGYLKDVGISKEQQQYVELLRSKQAEWGKTITANLPKASNPDYYYRDLMQFLVEDGEAGRDVEENIKTALIYAGLSWVAENANRSPWATNEEINQLLGRDTSTIPSREERDLYGQRMVLETVAADSLGNKALQAIGLKARRKGPNAAPMDLEPRLRTALGMHVIKLLQDHGFLERKGLATAESVAKELSLPVDKVLSALHSLHEEDTAAVKAMLDEGEATSSETVIAMLRVVGPQRTARALGLNDSTFMVERVYVLPARDSNQKMSEEAQAIKEASVGTFGVLDRLFGAESAEIWPTSEVNTAVQNTAKNTQQEVPTVTKEIHARTNAKPFFLNQDMWHVVDGFSDDLLLEAAGAVSVDPTRVNVVERQNGEAKNAGLSRELGYLREYVHHKLQDFDAPIFMKQTLWRTQRAGIESNTVNPQTSKLQRYMLYKEDWITEVDPNNPAEYDNFRLRVLATFGVDASKQSDAVSLALWKKKTQTPAVQEAVDALVRRLDGEDLSPQEQRHITDVVNSGGEKLHTLAGLVALAKEKGAKGKPFKTQLSGEIDGVNNGPILGRILFGAASTVGALMDTLKRGGFFMEGQDVDYNVWRGKPGNQDLYEIATQAILNKLRYLTSLPQENKKWVNKQILPHIFAFTGALEDEQRSVTSAGRKVAKTPMNALNFGSSTSRAVASMGENLVGAIYSSITAMASNAPRSMSREEIITHLRGLGLNVPLDMTEEQLLDLEFSSKEEAFIQKRFMNSFGKAASSALKELLADFHARTKLVNGVADVAHMVYESTYTTLRKAKVEALMDAEADQPGTGIPFRTIKNTGERIPLHDLTYQQDAELRKQLLPVMPVAHSIMSQDSNQLGAGIRIGDTEQQLTQATGYESNIKFGAPIQGTSVWSQKQGKYVGQTGRTVFSFSTVEQSPGVTMVSRLTHSFDSGISHYAGDGASVLNLHDSHGTGIGNFQERARALNQQTWEALVRYSPMQVMADTLSRTLQGYAKLVETGVLTKEDVSALKETLLTKYVEEDAPLTLSGWLRDARETAFSADTIRLQGLAATAVVNQYALEGGGYMVTPADHKKVTDLLAGLSKELTEEDLAALKVLEPQEKKNPFGDLGEASIPSDPALVDFLKDPANATLGAVASHLQTLLVEEGTSAAAVQRLLLRQAMAVLPKDMPIRMIMRNTPESEVLQMPNTPSRGWYVSKGDQQEINVLGPEFKDSGLTRETLLHEIVHAALARTVDKELKAKKANPNYTSEALALVEELEVLRSKATALVDKEGITGFDAALANVQEFIAWGMTDQKFQREVIAKTSIQSKTRKNSLVTGMKVFIDMIVGLLFKRSDKNRPAIAVNGMTALVQNVAGLYAQAKVDQKAAPDADSLNLSMASDQQDTLRELTTLDLHEALDAGDISPDFDTHIKGLLSGIVYRLQGPFGLLREEALSARSGDPITVWASTLAAGKAPLALSVQSAPFRVSEREGHAMEQVEVVVREALATPGLVYRDLLEVYQAARKKLTAADFHVGNWATAPLTERLAAAAQYEYLFDGEQGNAKNNLARFAAFGLAHEGTSKLLGFSMPETNKTQAANATWFQKLSAFFEKAVNFLNKKFTGVAAGQSAEERLKILVDTLVSVEERRRNALLARTEPDTLIEKASDSFKNGGEAVRSAANSVLSSGLIANSSFRVVRGAGSIARVVVNDQVSGVLAAISDLRERHRQDRHGVLMGLVDEVRGPTVALQKLLRLRKNVERERKATIDSVARNTAAMFADSGKELTREIKENISAVFLRTGAHTLLDTLGIPGLEKVLSSPVELKNTIAATERELQVFGDIRHDFIGQANVLAYYRATGRTRGAGMMMNAHNIVRLYGTGVTSTLSPDQQTQAEAIVKRLVALYALEYTSPAKKALAVTVLNKESQRTDGGNGIEATLKLHSFLEKESSARLFSEQAALMEHGHTPEAYNPHLSIEVATEAEGKELELLGFTKGAAVQLDPFDPDRSPKFLYVLKGGGLRPLQTGILSYSSKAAKGTERLVRGHRRQQSMQRALYTAGARQDLSKAGQTFMTPVVNPQGAVVSWRYLMEDTTKETLLERDAQFDKVLGMLAGSIMDKQTTREGNKDALAAAHRVFKTEYATKQHAFIQVGPNSPDAEMREIWQRLPEDTKTDAKRIWGGDAMYIRKDALDMVFGYRKLSAATMFEELNQWRKRRDLYAAMGRTFTEENPLNAMEKLITYAVEHVLILHARSKGMSQTDAERYSRKAASLVSRGENIWQEVVRETKDIIVVKSGIVLLGNIWSNTSLLRLNDVPFKDIVRYHAEALKGVRQYQADVDELGLLQQQQASGYTQQSPHEVSRRISQLEKALKHSPVTELVAAGLMPTIAEDVSLEEDQYSYKHGVVEWVKNKTKRVSTPFVEGAKQVYMAKDTKTYQLLRDSTQLSDFLARYSLYYHLTSRKKDALNKEEAIQKASTSFVNYDIPSHRTVQYLDDMGFLPFIKYFLRMQTVLVDLVKEHPGKVLVALLLDKFVGLGPIVLEGSALNKIGNNPFTTGALKFPETLDDLATVSAAMSLIK